MTNPTSRSNKPVKHHHVPRAYLENFCLANRTFYQYILRPGKGGSINAQWAGGNPNTTGWVKHLYDSPTDTSDRCHVEAELAKIERDAMKAIAQIIALKSNQFTFVTEPHVAKYIVAMAMRSPNAMRGKALLDPLVKAGLVMGDFPNNPGPAGVLRDIRAIQPELKKITWYLYWFDGRDGRILVTSDRPVGIYALAEQGRHTGTVLQAAPLEAAMPDNWAKHAIFTFPLTRACAAVGFKGPKKDIEYELGRQGGIECGDRLPGWVNAMSAWQASCVYTPDKGAKFLLPNPPNGPGEPQFT